MRAATERTSPSLPPRTRAHENSVALLELRPGERAHTHVLRNSVIWINSRMSRYVHLHSTAASSHRLPYLQPHDPPHASPHFHTTKSFHCSPLDPAASPFLTRNAAASPPGPVCQSVNQAVSPFTSSPHRPWVPIHKNEKGKKPKNPGRNIQWGEARSAQQMGAEREARVGVWSRAASAEFRLGSLSCAAHVGRARE